MMKKFKVTDLSTLQLEKYRLQELCDKAEADLSQEWLYLKKNHKKMAVGLFFPSLSSLTSFYDGAKDFLSGTMASLVGGDSATINKEQKQMLLKMLFKFAETALTSFLVRKFGTMFSKKAD